MRLDLEHLSASNIALHMKCPRQWQEVYMFKRRGPTSGAMFLGTAVHLGVRRRLMGEPLGDYWNDAKEEEGKTIDWGQRDTEQSLKRLSVNMIENYYDQVGKYLQVVGTEVGFSVMVPGIPIHFIGSIDLETHQILIDYKSTSYFNTKQVRTNEDWKLQQRVYQLARPKPSENHVITRKAEIVVPTQTTFKALHYGVFNRLQTERILLDEWKRILYHLDEYGEKPWPGKGLHEYAQKYCPLIKEGRCCA